MAAGARRGGASVVGLLQGDEEARRHYRGPGRSEQRFKRIACRKADINQDDNRDEKEIEAKTVEIENVKVLMTIVDGRVVYEERE